MALRARKGFEAFEKGAPGSLGKALCCYPQKDRFSDAVQRHATLHSVFIIKILILEKWLVLLFSIFFLLFSLFLYDFSPLFSTSFPGSNFFPLQKGRRKRDTLETRLRFIDWTFWVERVVRSKPFYFWLSRDWSEIL